MNFLRKAILFLRGEKLINSYWMLRGFQIQLRIEPPAFKKDCRAIYNAIDDEKETIAMDLLNTARSRWGEDTEFSYMDGLCLEFLPTESNGTDLEED